MQTHRNILHVIDIKRTLWSMLELIQSVTRTWVLNCQILFYSRGAALSLTGCIEACLYTITVLLLFCFNFLNSASVAGMPALVSLFLYMSHWVFLLNSVFHHWSMFYHCFILTIEQLPYHLFLLTVDPWGLLGVKKPWNAAHNLCLLDPAGLVPVPFIYQSVSARLCTVRKKTLWS